MDPGGDFTRPSKAFAHRSKDRVIDARLAEFLAHEQFRLLVEHGAALQHVMRDVPGQRTTGLQLQKVVRYATCHGIRPNAIFGRPSGDESRGGTVV